MSKPTAKASRIKFAIKLARLGVRAITEKSLKQRAGPKTLRTMKNLLVSSLIALLPVALIGKAAEPTVSSNDLPRFPAVEPREAIKTIQIKPGFHVEIAACEPNVASPIGVCFDENGRMFVIEMIDYSERREETPHLGRIRVLEDTDGDGVYDKSSVFADDLPWPTALFWWKGGLLVGATPDIWYLKDTNGDGKADTREKLFTGWAEGVKRINVQGMMNNLSWGLDNRIHGATSGNGGVGHALKHPDAKPLDLHGRDFVIEPHTWSLSSEAGGGQHGMSFDDWGHKFACNNSDHVRVYMYDDKYAGRNRYYNMPPCLDSIAVDGPAAEVYRISPEEPWRVIRTKWRVSGLVGGPIEGGGRASGYFTGATGGMIYRGNAFGKDFLDNYFVGDAGGNLVHRKLVIPDGVGWKAQRPADEQKVEFLACNDTWFRPVQMANSPDGSLLVIDMYREVIEHPWSLPESIKKFLDLNSGNDRGRIYRVVPDGFKRPARPQLGKASIKDLVATLEHPNAWQRDTASRLLYERQDKSAIKPLKALLAGGSKSALGRMHTLHALDGLNGLDEATVLGALGDPDPNVREHAVKLSEKFITQGKPSGQLWSKLNAMAGDPDIHVRYQLAFTLGEVKGTERIAPLAAIARKDVDSSWTRAAILSSLAEGAGDLFNKLSVDSAVTASNAGQDFLRELVVLVGAQNKQDEVARVVRFLSAVKQPALSFAMVRALSDGLQRAGSSLTSVGGNVQQIIEAASKCAVDPQADEATRVQAARLLGVTSFKESGHELLDLLNLSQPQAVQLAAISTLARFNDPQVGPELAQRWPTMTPRLREEAITVLVARPDRAVALLHGIEQGQIRAATLSSPQIKFLRNHKDKAVHDLAGKVLAANTASSRQQVIDQYMPALNLKGDAVHGKKIYEERCISCHRLGGEGFAVGPDLVTVKNTGKEKILVNVVDPNREVRPDYNSYLIETKDDESTIGLVVNETSNSVTVRQAYGKDTVINRPDIRKMQSQGQSLMPEGVEAGMSNQDMADLIQYIESADAK